MLCLQFRSRVSGMLICMVWVSLYGLCWEGSCLQLKFGNSRPASAERSAKDSISMSSSRGLGAAIHPSDNPQPSLHTLIPRLGPAWRNIAVDIPPCRLTSRKEPRFWFLTLFLQHGANRLGSWSGAHSTHIQGFGQAHRRQRMRRKQVFASISLRY
ncbi:hypothetical protein CGRA01v4_02070 [Colletotrichum graminicola]|nr:hypothetical protein CGRA01v4_02070 [Colletotrichum graminicola]